MNTKTSTPDMGRLLGMGWMGIALRQKVMIKTVWTSPVTRQEGSFGAGGGELSRKGLWLTTTHMEIWTGLGVGSDWGSTAAREGLVGRGRTLPHHQNGPPPIGLRGLYENPAILQVAGQYPQQGRRK